MSHWDEFVVVVDPSEKLLKNSDSPTLDGNVLGLNSRRKRSLSFCTQLMATYI